MKKGNSTTKDLALLVSTKLEGAKTSQAQPNIEVLEILFETLFYTSIKTEESQHIKVTITLINPENPDPSPPERIVANRWKCTHFTESIPFTVKNLVKLSKAADPWSSTLAVFYDNNNELIIWGMLDQALHYQSFLNYETDEGLDQPGLLQATITNIGCINVFVDYELIATLKQNTLISNYIDVFSMGQVEEFLTHHTKSLLAQIDSHIEEEFPSERENIGFWEYLLQDLINSTISRILIKIQNYQHGGAILMTPKVGSDLDIKYKLPYDRLSQSITNLIKLKIENDVASTIMHSDYIRKAKKNLPVHLYISENVSDFKIVETNDELKGSVRFISSLSCVDGLIVFSPQMNVLGFGGVIKLKDLPEYVYTSGHPFVFENKLTPFNPNHFGTRHRSMFSYCWNNPGSIGFVVSQDGDIRAIMKVNEKLIMWENIKVQQFLRSDKLKRKKIAVRK